MTQTYVDLIILITYLATIIMTCINVSNFFTKSFVVTALIVVIFIVFASSAAIITAILLPLNFIAAIASPATVMTETKQYYRLYETEQD